MLGCGPVSTPNNTLPDRTFDVSAPQGDVTTQTPEPGLRVVHAVGPADTATGSADTPTGPAAGTADETPPAATWLPVAEAAERTSVSESALRKWIKAGELAT